MTRTIRVLKLASAAAIAAIAIAALSSPAAALGWGITGFDGGAFEDVDGGLLTPAIGGVVNQAGAHPTTSSTTFSLTTAHGANGFEYASEEVKDIVVDLPPGLVGNVNALPTCRDSELTGGAASNSTAVRCPPASQVGFVDIRQGGDLATPKPGHPGEFIPTHGFLPVFNMEAPDGKAALLGFNATGAIVHLSAVLRHDGSAAGGYRVEFSALNAAQTLPVVATGFAVWGAPADPLLAGVHGWGIDKSEILNGERVAGISCVNPFAEQCPKPPLWASAEYLPVPFFTLPTSCEGPVQTDLRVTSWQGGEDSASFLSHDLGLPPIPIGNEGCNALDFSPTLQARPTTDVADAPSGLDVDLHVPQHETCASAPPAPLNCELAEAQLRDTTVTLPEGLSVNPASANGLAACSPAQIDLQGDDPANCPNASKLGTVTVDTPLLDHPVEGAVFIATPHDNPFGSLLAIYIALDDPRTGTVVKLAGEVKADPGTGQLSATVTENPQLPFEDFHLHFFGGAGGSLRTPQTCGTYTTQSSLTPWSAPDSGPPVTPSDSWAIARGPGGDCAADARALPSTPSFDAGTISPIAGARTPLVVNLRRDDGTQQFSALNLTPPEGLVGKLAGIPYCPEDALAAAAAKSGRAEEASQSCPQASYVGSVTAAAGAGPSPYYAPGKAFLTGPYKGAPLSIAIVAPATAGPFDLGTIVVRTALYVNPRTAQITAVSDPIPQLLQGIPLDVRSVQVRLDRPDFTTNPTSCDPMGFGGQLTTTLGQLTPLQSRFQLAECGRLGFQPSLSLRLEGRVKRGGYPALTATLRMPEGSANLASVSLALPHSEFLAQEHIRTVCTRVQFAADQCPPEAIYGTATVITPLLDYPLTGPVYLRSSDNLLPDLVPDLRGPANQPIRLESAGRTDSIKGGIRNTFDFVPDAPFTELVLQMQGGKKGLLVNSRNICRQKNRATVRYTAHNGKAYELRPPLRAQCGAAKKHRRHKRTA
jgi:hypothetical protein